MKNKKAIIALIALVVAVAALLTVYFVTRDTPDSKANPDAEKKTEVVEKNDSETDGAKPEDTTTPEDATTLDDSAAPDEGNVPDEGEEDPDVITLTVQIVYDDVDKEVELKTNEEYLSGALLGAGLIEGNDSEWGLYITTVDGRVASDEAHEFWGIYKDGEMTPTGADSTVIRDGEHYELVLGTW